MKSEKGITLTSLVIYIIVFSSVLALLSSLSNFVYGNMRKISSDSISSEEFNKFNTYFVKDVKNSKMATVQNDSSQTVITLENGSKYTYVNSEKAIYRDTVKIARNIIKFSASMKQQNNKNLIDVQISTGTNAKEPNFKKNIKYVLRYW